MPTHAIVSFDEHEDVIRHIRHSVFTLEQKVDGRIDFDGQDHEAVQVLVYDDGEAVGTGRMLEDGHIGRIAVMATHRQRGFGTIIICALIRFAREQQIDRVYLGAQVSAVPFYEKLGFVRDGADYIEANILHTPMALSLS